MIQMGTKGISRPIGFVFAQLLKGLDSPFRRRFNNSGEIVESSGIRAGQTVLEVGCGSGYFTPVIAERVGEQGTVRSIDKHPMAVESTERKVRALGIRNVLVSLGDAHAMPFPDESFDAVLVYGVIPAPVIDQTLLGREAYRLLKPGGVLAVWTAAPFWTPKTLSKSAPFKHWEKRNGVHRLIKS